MNNPNSTQVGGNHYQSTYQHWDLVLQTGMEYLEGCATKYIARWRKKGGIKDLEKAKHYLEKLASDVKQRPNVPVSLYHYRRNEVEKFNNANDLDPMESYLITVIVNWERSMQLKGVISDIDYLIAQNTFDTGEPGAGYVNQD